MAIRLGITGGIGSGKSLVCRLLKLLEIPVYISDAEAKRLMVSDTSVRKELVALLGEGVYIDRTLNKSLLASYIFGDSQHAKQVNDIIHPRIKEDFRQWVWHHTDEVVAIESAILLEAGFAAEVDVLVVVYAPVEVRIERAVKRDASSRELIEKRICNQMADEEKCKQADFIIVNDGETPLIPQVLKLITSLSKNIDYLCPV